MMMRSLLLLAALFAAPLAAAPFTVQGTGKSYDQLAEAVNAIGDGTDTILIAPGVHRQCAIQTAGYITYRAVRPQTAIFEGMPCEQKAALVLRGRGAVVDGLVFRKLSVPDGNGAGIRLERGPLDVTNSAFYDSEEGILSGLGDPSVSVRVDRSTFSGLGRCDRDLPCAHSIYIGGVGSVTVLRSRFERGTGGHYLKSRAAKIEVSDCSFDDVRGHTTNYMIDLPSGATGIIRRNIFVQGPDKENHSAFVAIAAEGKVNPSAGLMVVDNKAHLAPGVSWATAFVVDWSGEMLVIARNEIGNGIGLTRKMTEVRGIADKVRGKLRDYIGRARVLLIG